MSWMKQGQGGAPPPAAEQPPYGASQPYGNQQNMFTNYQGAPVSAPQQQYWQMQQQQQQPQSQYNQQYGQMYQQQGYGNNANQLYQQSAQYSQNFANQNFNTQGQQGYQQNYYVNQGVPQQNYVQNKANTDSWEDNWDWGWEDSSKQKPSVNQVATQENALLTQDPNNANTIEESFLPTNTWNWAMEDKKEPQVKPPLTTTVQENRPSSLPSQVPLKPDVAPQIESNIQGNASHALPQFASEDIKTLNDRDAIKERLPNLALGKRFHLENLTPQWSIESQMSQESSDGPQTHSEGTYRSENPSRNSSKGSPGLNTDNSNFNYSQSRLDEVYSQSSEWSKHSNEDATLIESKKSNNSRCESHDELSSSMQDMSISNTENTATNSTKADNEVEQKVAEFLPPPFQPPPSSSPADFVQPAPSNVGPHISTAMPPPPPVSTATQPLPTMSTTSGPPPTNFPPPTASQNPFKHAGPFSHKNISKAHSNAPSQPFPPQISNSNLASPAVVSKINQANRMPVGFGANLETTPDNSERPDQPQTANFRPIPVSQQIPDNMEVAPQNDRNEYLQTEHLSSVDYGENTDFSRSVPPPGLRRMVVGQQEAEYSQNLNVSGDEPPPGLARMVPGQQTESDNIYIQSNDNYMDRHVDGQMNDNAVRPFRQADGQQTSDNYTQPPANRSSERRPIGLDRMVPGESSNNEYTQYQSGNYGSSNEPRVVTGVDHDYPLRSDAGPTDVREQNVDGSDYSEPPVRNPTRNVIGLRESTNESSVDFGTAHEEEQREVTMEGENLQDLSIISGADMTFSREQMFDVVSGNITEVGKDRSHEASDSVEYPANGSRRQSVNRTNTSGEDSERERTFKSSPRRDRDKHKSSRDRDRDRERDKDGRYSRGDRKFDRDPDRRSVRDGRRSEKDRRDRDRDREKDRERRDREVSPESRRHRRSTRSHRYETEDTDYYSDRERDRRRYREGSYSSKPPRPDEKQRRHDDRRRYNTTDREARYDEESSSRRRGDRHPDKYERRYRDIDTTRKYGSQRREDDERRRGETYSSPSRAGSREATATDEDAPDSERRRRARERRPRDRQPDPYYMANYGRTYGDPFLLQRQQYSYYERLRRTDPAAYTRLYEQLLAAPHNLYAEGYGPMGYEGRTEERASVHSGRSSANGLKPNDTYYGGCRLDGGSLRDAPSLRTDLSDRDLNTDASLNLHLEESTVRSERMTPFKYSTAHIKGSVSAQHVVMVVAAYPVDGRPATVQLLPLAQARAHDPALRHLLDYPGPLIRGVTHKKSVIEYCKTRVSNAQNTRDPLGYVLLWDLLALMLRQNGVVVGTDIAELLMKNARDYEYKPGNKATPRPESRRDSSVSGEAGRDDERISSPDQPSGSTELTPPEEDSSSQTAPIDEKAALDRLREYLVYGNRQEALEWAIRSQLWGHALQLAAHSERRVRVGVASRFVASLPRADPLHTLYAALAARTPPAATCVAEERWGDWRPHAAILLANSGARPDHDRRTLMQLGDSLASRGLPYCAQFCYVAGGVPFARHPLAPLQPADAAGAAGASAPRLSLLLADPRAATLPQLATDQAIFATEIYEYALSLNQEDFVIEDFQVYKLMAACRLLDAGQCERALAYVEQAARAVTRDPRRFSAALARRLALLADRLKYYDPALQEEPPLVEEAADGSAQPSPRHQQQWLDDVRNVAEMLQAEAWQQLQQNQQNLNQTVQPDPVYHEQTLQYQQPVQTYSNDVEDRPDYSGQYYQGQLQQPQAQLPQMPQPPQQNQQPQLHYQDSPYSQHDQGSQGEVETHTHAQPYSDEWPRQEEQAQSYADPYWQNDTHYGYGEPAQAGLRRRRAPPRPAEPVAPPPPARPDRTPPRPEAPPKTSQLEMAQGDGEGVEQRPSITMPGSVPSKPSPYADYDADDPPIANNNGVQREAHQSEGGKGEGKVKEDSSKGEGKAKSGWLGGFLNKLSLRAPNQMILPDDKNPTIVWDAEHKRWRNLEGDEDDTPRPPPPPPAVTLAPTAIPQSGVVGAPGAPPVANIFKMQKGRHIKKSYVDVFNPSGAATRPLPPAAEVLGAPPPGAGAPPTNYFVPAPLAQQGGYYESAGNEGDQYRSGI